MRIGIDARWIFEEISGIGAYTLELIRELARLDKHNQYLLLFDSGRLAQRTRDDAGLAGYPNVGTLVLPWGVFSLRNQLLLPRVLGQRKLDVFHSTNYMIPLAAFPRHGRGATRCVATVHDVIPMLFPHHAPRSRKARMYWIYRRLMLDVGRRADRIITDSHASRADLLSELCIPPGRADKVRVVPCGVSQRFEPADTKPVDESNDRLRTVLYVGRIDPYKNVANLIRAFGQMRAALPFPVRLLFAGPSDARYPEPAALAAGLGLSGSVQWSGYLSDPALVAAYRDADLLAQPSRYEGFGLQVAEAMACGTPVVCSTAEALREVAGDAALFVDPDDVEGWSRSMARVLTSPALCGKLVRKGLRRAVRFSWKDTALKTLAIYEELHGNP